MRSKITLERTVSQASEFINEEDVRETDILNGPYPPEKAESSRPTGAKLAEAILRMARMQKTADHK